MRALLYGVLTLTVLASSAFGHGGFPLLPPGPGPNGVPPVGVPVPTGTGTGATSLPPLPNPTTGQNSGVAVPAGNPTTGTGAGLDQSGEWPAWWQANQHAFLELKAHVHGQGSPGTGGSDFFLGQGTENERRAGLQPTETQVAERIVPALIATLEDEDVQIAHEACLIALAKIGGSRGASASQLILLFRDRLADPRQSIAESAALSLGILGEEAAAPYLIALLEDDAFARRNLVKKSAVPRRTRTYAAYAMGLLGRRASVRTQRDLVRGLAAVLAEDQEAGLDVPVAAAIALGLIPLAELGSAAEDAPPEAGLRAQIALLEEALEAKDLPDRVRAHLPVSLARLAAKVPGEAGLELRERLAADFGRRLDRRTKDDFEVQAGCALALGHLGRAGLAEARGKSLAALIDASEQASGWTARRFAMMGLAELASAPAGEDPSSHPDHADDRRKAEKHLAALLVRGHTQSRPWAALALALYGRRLQEQGEELPEDLASSLRFSFTEEVVPSHVGAYSLALGLIRDQASKDDLLEALDDLRDDSARGSVGLGAGLAGIQEAIEPLQAIVAEARYRPELLNRSATALGLLEDKAVVPSLLRQLEKASSLATQAAIAGAMGWIGDARAVDPLVALLQDDQVTDSARSFAAVALGLVADRYPRPWSAEISIGLNYAAAPKTLFDPTYATDGVLNLF